MEVTEDMPLTHLSQIPCIPTGHHCCKTTTRKGKARPQDFYCFLDKGSPLGNYWYCLGLADDPPEIKPATDSQSDEPISRSLRAEATQPNVESTASRMKVLSLLLLASLLTLILYKRVVNKLLTGSNCDTESDSWTCHLLTPETKKPQRQTECRPKRKPNALMKPPFM